MAGQRLFFSSACLSRSDASERPRSGVAVGKLCPRPRQDGSGRFQGPSVVVGRGRWRAPIASPHPPASPGRAPQNVLKVGVLRPWPREDGSGLFLFRPSCMCPWEKARTDRFPSSARAERGRAVYGHWPYSGGTVFTLPPTDRFPHPLVSPCLAPPSAPGCDGVCVGGLCCHMVVGAPEEVSSG